MVAALRAKASPKDSMPADKTSHIDTAAKIARAARTTYDLAKIWVEAWGLAFLAVSTITRPSGAVRWMGIAIIVLFLLSRAYWGAIWKNVNDSNELRFTSKHHWRDVCDACGLAVAGKKGKTLYPKVRTKVGPLLPPKKMLAMALKPTSKGGGVRVALQPQWLEHKIKPLSKQWPDSFRQALEGSLKQHYDFGSVSSIPQGNWWLIRLSPDVDPYVLEIDDDDEDLITVSEDADVIQIGAA